MNLHDTHPFLCRSPFLPGESLASLLVRLSILNAYPSPDTVISIGKERLSVKDVLTQPRCAETYDVLADLTQLAPGTLYRATPHAFAQRLTLPDDEFPTVELAEGEVVPLLSPSMLQHHIWSAQRASYCPRCLQEGPYHRLAWMFCALNICLTHHCLLVRECQACQAPLRVTDIVKGQCPKCQFDLAAAAAAVSGDEFGLFAQATLLGWLGVGAEASCTHVVRPDGLRPNWLQWASSLPPQSGSVLYRLVTGIQRSLFGIGPEWSYWHPVGRHFWVPSASRQAGLQSLTPGMAYLLLATAFQAVANWPHNFYTFLDAYQERARRTNTPTFSRDFGTLYHLCLAQRWSSSHFQFVQEAFDDYLVESYPLTVSLFSCHRYWSTPQFANRLPCMPADEAAKRLQTTSRVLNRLLASGFLVNYRGMVTSKSFYQPGFICRPEVLALENRWSSGIPQEDAARLLGVSVSILADLIDAGMLTTICVPLVEDAGPTLAHKPIMSLLDRLMYGGTSRGALQPYTGFLDEIAPTLIRFGYRPAMVMHLARKHLIRFGWENQPGPHFGAFWVSTEDLDFQLELLTDDRLFLSRVQAAHRLQVPVAILMAWSGRGLIPCLREKGMGWQFARADVEQFAAQYVVLEEAAYLLGIYSQTLRLWVKKGLLSPISSRGIDRCQRLLFRRADVEQLRLSRRRKARDFS
ncbi:MAG: TniQ family protein [Chloroflexi bacterium]|nr:TniQ family protein [Chloroflexota bacterium]